MESFCPFFPPLLRLNIQKKGHIYSSRESSRTTMADCITIAPELSFKDQVCSTPLFLVNFGLTDLFLVPFQKITELAAHLSRSLPNADNQVAVKEFVQGYEAQVDTEEGRGDVEDAKKKQVVKSIVDKFVELKGGLEAAKESGQLTSFC